MRSIFSPPQADGVNPLVDQPGVLPRAEVGRVVDPTWECIIVNGAAAKLKPSDQASSYIGCELELHGPSGLLLHDNRPRSNLGTRYNVSDFDLDQVTTAQFAIDRKIEQRTVSDTPFPI